MDITLEELVIELILQDLKHNQLIYGLDRLNLDAGYCHFLGILDLVQRLMKVPEAICLQSAVTHSISFGNLLD